MQQMAIDRRLFLRGLALSACAPGLAFGPDLAFARWAADRPCYAGVRRHNSGQFFVSLISANGRILNEFPLPARAHGMAHDPHRNRLVVFARRPGTFAVIFDLDRNQQVQTISTPANRHFLGHGVFSQDGSRLYATENDFENGRGAIGIYDMSTDFQRIGESSSGGIGPHDIALLPDGKTLAIANGGISTHPSYPRVPLNLGSMASSLTYVDMNSGKLLDTQVLPQEWQQLSFRHIAVVKTGQVAIGCQFKGPKVKQAPLILLHKMGHSLRFAQLPPLANRSLRHYVGSITTDRTGRFIAASSPRGNKVVYLDGETGTYLGRTSLHDVCGIGSRKRDAGFIITGGNKIAIANRVGGDMTTRFLSQTEATDWDNHLLTL